MLERHVSHDTLRHIHPNIDVLTKTSQGRSPHSKD